MEKMMDLIERQAAIDALKQQAEEMSHWSGRYAEQRKGILTAINIVSDLPSAQSEPCEDAVSRADAMTELQYNGARRWVLSQEAHGEGRVEWSDELIAVESALQTLRELPSITLKQKTGKWIYQDDGTMTYDSYKCSECGKIITVDAERVCDIGFVIEDMRFCPNCGSFNGDVRNG